MFGFLLYFFVAIRALKKFVFSNAALMIEFEKAFIDLIKEYTILHLNEWIFQDALQLGKQLIKIIKSRFNNVLPKSNDHFNFTVVKEECKEDFIQIEYSKVIQIFKNVVCSNISTYNSLCEVHYRDSCFSFQNFVMVMAWAQSSDEDTKHKMYFKAFERDLKAGMLLQIV
jgi:hypothetical protein